jgi:hypothetical protein
MKSKFPFVLYFFGLASLFLCDFIVVNNFASENVSQWALLRALVGMLGVVSLVGMDQVIFRLPKQAEMIVNSLVLQVPVLSIIAACILLLFEFNISIISTFFVSVGSASLMLGFQYFRSRNMLIHAQLSEQSWKVICFLLILIHYSLDDFLDFEFEYLIPLSIVLSSIVVWVYIFRCNIMLNISRAKFDAANYSIGFQLMITSLLLAASIYFEQILLNIYGDHAESALYFSYSLYFILPISAINGYLAFLIGPIIRDGLPKVFVLWKKKSFLILLLIFLYCLTFNIGAYFLWTSFLPRQIEMDTYMQIFFFVCTLIRTLYLFPAAFVGVYSNSALQFSYVKHQIVGFALAISLFSMLLMLDIFNVVYCVAIFSLVNWLFRFVASVFAMRSTVEFSRGF